MFKNLLFLVLLFFLFIYKLDATETHTAKTNLKMVQDKKIKSQKKKWKVILINENIYKKTGGMEGKYIIYTNTKKEAKKVKIKFLDKIKNTYQNMSIFLSLFFLVFQYTKIKNLQEILKNLKEKKEILLNKNKIKVKIDEINNQIKFEVYYGIFIIFLINIFYWILTYNYLSNIKIIIEKNF